MRPYRLITWAVTKSATIGVVLGQGQTLKPNSNCPSAGSLVVQVTVAADVVILETEMDEMMGGVVSRIICVVALAMEDWPDILPAAS